MSLWRGFGTRKPQETTEILPSLNEIAIKQLPEAWKAFLSKSQYREIEQERNAALNPSTPPAILRELFIKYTARPRNLHTLYARMQFLVVVNPNASLELLLLARREHARAVMDNPAFLLHLLADSNFLNNLHYEVQQYIAAYTTDNDVLRSYVYSAHRAVRLAAVGNPTIPPEILREVIHRDNPDLWEGVAKNDQAPEDVLLHLIACEHSSIRLAASKNLSFPKEILEKILSLTAGNSLTQDRANSKVVIDEEWSSLFYQWGPWTRLLLADHHYAPVAWLRKLSRTSDEKILLRLASNPNSPSDIVEMLAARQSITLRQAALRHPQASLILSVILRLSEKADLSSDEPNQASAFTDEEWQYLVDIGAWTRMLVAQHTSAPLWVIDKLLRRRNVELLRLLARNPQVPHMMLQVFLQSGDVTMWRELSQNEALSSELVTILWELPEAKKHIDVIRALAHHPNASAATLQQLSQHTESGVRKAVAENPQTPAEILHALATTAKEGSVRIAIAANPNTSTETLRYLLENNGTSQRSVEITIRTRQASTQIPAETPAQNQE